MEAPIYFLSLYQVYIFLYLLAIAYRQPAPTPYEQYSSLGTMFTEQKYLQSEKKYRDQQLLYYLKYDSITEWNGQSTVMILSSS